MKSVLFFFDNLFIKIAKICCLPFARISLFIVFFWFGILKVFGLSPANKLVEELLEKTLYFISFDQFIIFFGIFEMIIGLSFLIPKLTRISIAMLMFHMITTFMPLVLIPNMAWRGIFVPTLEGQYIIKNLLIIAVSFDIVSKMHLPNKC